MIDVTPVTFSEEVLASDVPVLVDFWAEWCGPCKMIEKSLEEIASDLGKTYKFVKVNADAHPRLLLDYDVMSLPTLIIFRDGKEVDRIIGAAGNGAIKKRLETLA